MNTTLTLPTGITKTTPAAFNATKSERAIIQKIVDRAVKKAFLMDVEYPRNTIDMDLVACHCNGNPLDLKKLLAADDLNFCHDIFGIRNHICRKTGALKYHFSPRHSLPEASTKE